MARSKYIYHIREHEDGLIVASFTVKREAHEWMERSGLNFLEHILFRVRDGLCEFGQKFETKVNWDE